MHLNQKNLIKIVVGSFILSAIAAIIEVVSILGIYSCQTNKCVNHDASGFKLSAFHVVDITIWLVFLISLLMLMVVSIKKKQ